jgi:hypothetical protein
MYVHHRDRFFHEHNKRFVPRVIEFTELENRYFDQLNVVDVSRSDDPKDALRRDMHKKGKEVLKELERVKKEWEKALKRIEKMP